MSAYRSLACNKALDGIQPTLRQVPPRVSRISMQAVFMPSCAARMAATYPPGPPPMTTKSYALAMPHALTSKTKCFHVHFHKHSSHDRAPFYRKTQAPEITLNAHLHSSQISGNSQLLNWSQQQKSLSIREGYARSQLAAERRDHCRSTLSA